MYSNPNLKPNTQQLYPLKNQTGRGFDKSLTALPDKGYSDFQEEFRRSAIPDQLTRLNVQWIEGSAAIELLASEAVASAQRVTSYLSKPSQDILKKYQFAGAGGWYAVGCTLSGTLAEVPYFKPIAPRLDIENRKLIKYETPQGMEALPLLPFVDPASAQLIYTRYQVTPAPGESFWQVVKRCGLPVALVEGLKKSLALIAHGLPAVALRGVTQWHQKQDPNLHPLIAELLSPGQTVQIIFDQDEKPKTQAAVRKQALKLGEALEQVGCKVRVSQWDRTIGKGIDDALFNSGANAQTWLDSVLSEALDLATYQRDSRVLKALENLKRLTSLTYPIERATDGEYLPSIPSLQRGTIHVLSANMNAGKTTRIGQDWVKDSEAFNLVLSPTNATGQQTAFNWDLPHIHNYATDPESQKALWTDASHRGGLVLCPESLHRLPNWLWEKPVNLILDEANQVIHGLTEGDTLGSRYGDILERFAAAARHSIATGAIVLSEDGIPDSAVNFTRSISGATAVRVFTHQKESQPWEVTLNRGQASGFRAQLVEAATHNRVLYVTSSQREGARLERAIRKLAPARHVIRIDSETNENGQFTEFFEQPDQWLQTNQPDLLILSPSAKSGVSIEGGVTVENAYFSAVWAYFPVLGTDTHAQLLGRYRPAVPRVVFCPDFILSDADESLLSPRAIKRRLNLNARALAGVYGVTDLLTAPEDEGELKATLQIAVLDYLTDAKATIGNQKQIAHIALAHKLTSAGHHVTCEPLKKEPTMVTTWKAITEEIEREEATAIATAVIEPHHTLEWAKKQRNGLDVSKADRILARKVIDRDQFPGILFDCPEECYQALTRDYGAMARGARLQAKAENLEAAKQEDADAVKAILSDKVKAFHRLPKDHVKALLIGKSGVLELLDGSIYTNSDPRCQRVKEWAVKFADEIKHWLDLTIQQSQSAIAICHKLLRRLGLERDKADRPGAIHMVDRKGKRGSNSERFRVDVNFDPIRIRLLEAARRKRSESVTLISNIENQDIGIDVTGLKPPEIGRSHHSLSSETMIDKSHPLQNNLPPLIPSQK